MQMWEYRYEEQPKQAFEFFGVETLDLQSWLNAMGQDGWELVHIVVDTKRSVSSWIYVFKRPDISRLIGRGNPVILYLR